MPDPNSPKRGMPPLDFSASAYTGWTRAHWIALLARATYGFARRVARTGSAARVLYPDDHAGHPDSVNGLESFSRLALIWGAWLHHPANSPRLSFQGYDLNLAHLLQQGLVQGTNPASRFYWGHIAHMDQRIVECSNIALAIWFSRAHVWDELTAAEQARVAAWLAQVDGKGTYPDNWVMFPAISQAVRLRLGHAAPAADLRRRLEAMAAFYRGDGWYVDGPTDEYDLYNAWMFGGHYLLWAWIDGDRHADLRDQILQRARSFLAGFQYFFGANGSYVAWGRSLGSRVGALIAFALGHALGVAPPDTGLLRRLSSGSLRYFAERGLFHPSEHYLTQGFHGPNRLALESYVSPGSPHSALAGLLALTFDSADPFWTAPESPLPVERGDFEVVLPTPGFVVSGRQATGQVLLLNSRAGHVADIGGHNYLPKYGKLAYSTHFPFNVIPVHGGYAPDAMPSLTADGRTFAHRALTRHSGAAPGLVWSQFDELVNDEPQAMATAVLLWRDVQVVLTTVAPTLPVMVYHAPAALGCDRPAGHIRRSDPAAGWEYAQAEGRAVAIARLLGYDAQTPSAPFLGRSTLNLAYPYAEQPLVHEAAPSVLPRALASLALARPLPFDPAAELAGFTVAEAGGVFTITCPDGTLAAIVLGSRLPSTIRLGTVTFSGPALRYVRLLPAGRGASGQGVQHVEGMLTFDAPATFDLERQPDGAATLTTDTGAVVDSSWLGRPLATVAARTLAGAWEPVPDCAAATVRAWQARTERRLVEFRIN
jgi:hypothetical protein